MDSSNLLIGEIKKNLGAIHLQLSQLEAQIAELEKCMGNLKSENEGLQALKNAVAMAMGKPVSETVVPQPVQNVEQKEEDKKEVASPAVKVENVVSSKSVVAEQKKQEVSQHTTTSSRPVDGRLIQDLHKAIGLNDRLRFRHDLFGNDNDLMNKTIDVLDQMEDETSATKYISDNFNWNSEDDTVKYFMDIIHRRFFV